MLSQHTFDLIARDVSTWLASSRRLVRQLARDAIGDITSADVARRERRAVDVLAEALKREFQRDRADNEPPIFDAIAIDEADVEYFFNFDAALAAHPWRKTARDVLVQCGYVRPPETGISRRRDGGFRPA